jgi:hypothetical protein
MADYRELAAALGGGYGQDTGPITPDTLITLKNGKTASAGDLLGLLKGFGQSVGSNLESLVRGGAASVPGMGGDLESFGRMGINKLYGAGGVNVSETPVLPTTTDILGMIPRATAPRQETAGMEELGGFMTPATAKVLKPAVTSVARMAGQEINAGLTGQPTRSLLGDITPKPLMAVEPSQNASLLGQTKPKDESVRIYRGSFETNPEYSVLENYPNAVYNGVFGSSNLQSAQAHGSGTIHFTDIPKNKIVTHYELNYEIPYEKTKNALLKERPDLKNNSKLFDELYDIVVGDAGQDLQNLDDNKIIDLFRTSPDEANNEAQRLRGLVAKNLGYKAIEMTDEHGAGTYLVTPGAKFKSIK